MDSFRRGVFDSLYRKKFGSKQIFWQKKIRQIKAQRKILKMKDKPHTITTRPRKSGGVSPSLLNEVRDNIMKDKVVVAEHIGTPPPFDLVFDGPGGEPNLAELSNITFEEEVKIDFIDGIDLRILCRFLGVTAVNDIKEHVFKEAPLIVYLVMHKVDAFMKSKGYQYAGELNFNNDGGPVPTQKQVWRVNGSDHSFTINGYMYYEKVEEDVTGSDREGIGFLAFSDTNHCVAQLSCFTDDEKKSENIVLELVEYAKQSNCLRGAKVKEVNIANATFEEVHCDPKYNWNTYYYPQDIQDLFREEIFGFLKDVKKYNKDGICKRGFMCYGKPGGGKTTIGYIVCNNLPDNTVVWVTPDSIQENRYNALSSIRMLFKLNDYVTPSVVILEDMDLYGEDREVARDSLALGGLMNILDGVNSVKNSVTLATTNRLEVIENALRNRPGRFDRVVEIPVLSDELRGKMIKNRLASWKMSKDVVDYFLAQTSGWTGAEIQEFINSLSLKCINNSKIRKTLTKEMIDEIIKKMRAFGINNIKRMGFGDD